jgi:methylated-DNA-protein-cysteine methyltransferase-like protein
MPQRSEQAEAWFATVCTAVQEIPHGKVTSYGHIARLVGKRTARLNGSLHPVKR